MIFLSFKIFFKQMREFRHLGIIANQLKILGRKGKEKINMTTFLTKCILGWKIIKHTNA